jgi:hypothetical protein
MSCVHIQRLYELCRTHNLRLTSGDLVRIVCRECGIQDRCPSSLVDERKMDAPEEQPAGIVAQYAQCGPAKP